MRVSASVCILAQFETHSEEIIVMTVSVDLSELQWPVQSFIALLHSDITHSWSLKYTGDNGFFFGKLGQKLEMRSFYFVEMSA